MERRFAQIRVHQQGSRAILSEHRGQICSQSALAFAGNAAGNEDDLRWRPAAREQQRSAQRTQPFAERARAAAQHSEWSRYAAQHRALRKSS